MFYYFSGLIFMEDSFNPSTQEVGGKRISEFEDGLVYRRQSELHRETQPRKTNKRKSPPEKSMIILTNRRILTLKTLINIKTY